MIKTLPLHLRINLRGKLAASNRYYTAASTANAQSARYIFRYKGCYGCVILTAKDAIGALKQAHLHTAPLWAHRKNMEVWDDIENSYKPAFPPKVKKLTQPQIG